MQARNVIVFVDPNISKQGLPCMHTLLDSLSRNKLDVHIYDKVRVEPSDGSFQDAISFMAELHGSVPGGLDAVVALGGGSTIDTAKAANLYTSHPPPDGNFYTYVNPVIGKGQPIPGPLLPLIAVPTTAGTGSETTGVAIFDDVPSKSKTGIAHRRLKPTLGVIDPHNTTTLPPEVAKYSGLDVLCHAIESYTAIPYNERPKPPSPLHRPAYQGSNPISDVWSLHALRTAATYISRAVRHPEDVKSRSEMLLAAAAAGVGFGNAGVHLCHGMSYPIASQVKSYVPPGYDGVDHPLVPHGHSVIVNAPSVFQFTGRAAPERHLECARILAAAREDKGTRGTLDGMAKETNSLGSPDDAGKYLAQEIRYVLLDLDVPIGLRALGYNESDIDELVEGTLPQHRVTKLSPRPVGKAELDMLFRDALDGGG
jgi:hydroxyacid-oxoacid transhydrogenase